MQVANQLYGDGGAQSALMKNNGPMLIGEVKHKPEEHTTDETGNTHPSSFRNICFHYFCFLTCGLLLFHYFIFDALFYFFVACPHDIVEQCLTCFVHSAVVAGV